MFRTQVFSWVSARITERWSGRRLVEGAVCFDNWTGRCALQGPRPEQGCGAGSWGLGGEGQEGGE